MEDRFWDCAITETVSLRRRTGPDTFTTYTAITAVRRVLAKTDIQARGGDLAESSIVFHLRASTLTGSNIPRVGDAIRDSDSIDYWITSARLETWGKRWRVECNKGK